jgi:hypothetical protein
MRQPLMTASDRTGYVIVQLAAARQALARGELGVARAALRALRTSDFVAGFTVAEPHFAVLRDLRSGEDEVREAIAALIDLRPAGLGGDR